MFGFNLGKLIVVVCYIEVGGLLEFVLCVDGFYVGFLINIVLIGSIGYDVGKVIF